MRRRSFKLFSATGWSLVIVLGFGLGLGCASFSHAPARNYTHYTYFSTPDADDAWSPKIAGWQRREHDDVGLNPPHVAADADPGASHEPFDPNPPAELAIEADDTLRGKYFAFRAERKRALARQLALWVQAQAKQHYVADGASDHWATLEETLRGDGDDCDGLELLTFHGLRDLGFAETEVYRAIVFRESDGQHHMVTLWFEQSDDPWVIDPTGAMTSGMPRMSELPGWVPLKLFSDTVEYTVRPNGLITRTDNLAQNR